MGSLFDGIGGFPYAASFYGIRSLWASEIVPECVSVTKKHFPNMEHIGDITRLDGAKLPPVDIITFGSPCQDLSVASGRRLGLAGERSGLFWEAIRIIREMQEATNGAYPEFAIWENVPGATSSAAGRSFQAVLAAFTKSKIPMPRSGKWANAGMVRGGGIDLAWCIYNSQYFGTAQRRRRLFLVADFRGKHAGEILFVPKSLRGYFEAGGTPRQGLTAFAESGADTAGGNATALSDQGGDSMVYPKIAGTLCASGAGLSRPAGMGSELDFCIRIGSCVRRLTPLEAERLMGFPDFWTEYGLDGKPISDTKRYSMLGNSVAVPCVAYIMQGIRDALRKGA